MGTRAKAGHGPCICSPGVKGLAGVHNRSVKLGEPLLGVYIWVSVHSLFSDIMSGSVFIVIYSR